MLCFVQIPAAFWGSLEVSFTFPYQSSIHRVRDSEVIMQIFVTRSIPEAGLTLLRQTAEVVVWQGPEKAMPSKEQILGGVRKM